MKIKIKKLVPHAKVPTYAHTTDAGMDFYALEDVIIQPMQRIKIRTGIAMQIPDGYVGLVWDKSGISYSKGLKVIGGVADAGYRGEIFIGVVNLADEPIMFEAGDKVAQMLIQKVEYAETIEVSELDVSDRGTGAFGSTGAK